MDDAAYDQKYTERRVLLGYLNKVRDAVVPASEALSEQQVREPGVPSQTSLLGLIQHLMSVPVGLSRVEVVAGYRRACRRSDEIV